MADESNEEIDTPKASASSGKKKMKLIKRPKAPAREQSSIAFPYQDLETGISMADAILKAGGVALTREQLASVTGFAVNSGNFVTKIAAARLFGLINYAQGRYELTDLAFSILDKDEKRQRAARAEAFLNVPLYRRTYDEFRGKQLPPRPHGLEQAFIRFGVAPKQKTNARLAFDKSAKQAGYFSSGQDRLIEPIVGPLSDRSRSVSASTPADYEDSPTAPTIPEPPANDYHPFIQGLLDTLPEPDTNWTIEGRTKWLQAAANIFDLIYKGSGEIHITGKAGHPQGTHTPEQAS